MRVLRRVHRPAVALETTLLVHGLPRASALQAQARLVRAVRSAGSHPALTGVVAGTPIVGMTDDELRTMLDAPRVAKANSANLGVALHTLSHAATTVSTTVELAAAAGVHIFATGGLGGVHPGLAQRLDISADLAALARFPVAVVCAGVKSILDVESSRELLETLGVPVVGFRTDDFPAFYVARSAARVDIRIDDHAELARFVAAELGRANRGIVIAQPPPERSAFDPADWADLLARAAERVASQAHATTGRDLTPATLAAVHELSQGKTLAANLDLAENNALLAGHLAAALHRLERRASHA